MSNVMTATQRNSGIPLLDEIAWGSHLCVFYESEDDLFDLVSSYLDAGLQANELCVWRVPRNIALERAEARVRANIDDFDRHFAAGRLQIVAFGEGQSFDLAEAERFWLAKIDYAISAGFEGLRGCGDASVLDETEQSGEYERVLDTLVNGRPALALCTYALSTARAMDVFDVMRAHSVTVARRNGEWQFMETPELQGEDAPGRNLDDALAILSTPFPGRELLTERERMVLAYLVKGASSKEAGRELGISPRTNDFHRENIIEKLGARNVADAIRRVLSPA
jgi:DNA-binding CsgD family transcriptional regulator